VGRPLGAMCITEGHGPLLDFRIIFLALLSVVVQMAVSNSGDSFLGRWVLVRLGFSTEYCWVLLVLPVMSAELVPLSVAQRD